MKSHDPYSSVAVRVAQVLSRAPAGEHDLSFQEELERQTRRGMVVTASLGVLGATLFVAVHLLTGSVLVWLETDPEAATVALADKTFIVALCVLLLGAARAPNVRSWGRVLLGVVMVVSGFAIGLDDYVRGDFSFTVAWLVLVQLVAVGTVPYTPRQSLAISGGMVGVYVALLASQPDALDSELHEHRWAYFLFATIIVVTLATYLYGARYRQHLAKREVERLGDRLAARTEQLEASLAELETAQHRLLLQERFAALGQITSGVAHEIQNPLNFVTNFAGLNEELLGELREAMASADTSVQPALGCEVVECILDDLAANSAAVAKHGRRAAQIVSRMQEHARNATGDPVSLPLAHFLSDHVQIAVRRFGNRSPGSAHVTVRNECSDAVHVVVRPSEMGAAIQNLLDNALRAASEGGDPAPRVVVTTEVQSGSVEIRVSDNGPGISPEHAERLFEPFFTTRTPGEGAGLGLALTQGIALDHGGALWADHSSGRGAVFVLSLPLASPLLPVT